MHRKCLVPYIGLHVCIVHMVYYDSFEKQVQHCLDTTLFASLRICKTGYNVLSTVNCCKYNPLQTER